MADPKFRDMSYAVYMYTFRLWWVRAVRESDCRKTVMNTATIFEPQGRGK
jgi:hypothetical protein